MGKDNTRLLEVITFDFSLLDKAAQYSSEMADLLAAMTRDNERGTVSHDAALSPGDDEIKQSNFMAVPHDAAASP